MEFLRPSQCKKRVRCQAIERYLFVVGLALLVVGIWGASIELIHYVQTGEFTGQGAAWQILLYISMFFMLSVSIVKRLSQFDYIEVPNALAERWHAYVRRWPVDDEEFDLLHDLSQSWRLYATAGYTIAQRQMFDNQITERIITHARSVGIP